ncbi:MAG TPA: DUF104 domain-containing protein [Acidobacteriota bacterium]|nr:DUF104 domain-containing protein [Acidobacteriota bacterium]
MSVVTIEGIIQDGKIELLEKVDLPEKTKVFVVIPDFSLSQTPPEKAKVVSPRLKERSFIQDFMIEVIDQEK